MQLVQFINIYMIFSYVLNTILVYLFLLHRLYYILMCNTHIYQKSMPLGIAISNTSIHFLVHPWFLCSLIPMFFDFHIPYLSYSLVLIFLKLSKFSKFLFSWPIKRLLCLFVLYPNCLIFKYNTRHWNTSIHIHLHNSNLFKN